MKSSVERHAFICAELFSLYKKKNADYGDSFHKTFVEEGYAMSRIRLTDKLERFKRLSRSNEQNVKDESIRDTLIDLANYAIMTIIELDGESDESNTSRESSWLYGREREYNSNRSVE